jgi:orotidine-5'-phosphate decarboxylase
MIVDQLIEAIEDKQNPTALGLDTRLEYLPGNFAKKFDTKTLMGASGAILAFNKALVDGLKDVVACVKVQAAYYEMYGMPGIAVMEETVRYCRENGLVVILDGKRNDIGATSEAYANAYLGQTSLTGRRVETFAADFLTVNPYLGIDGVEPFVKAAREYDRGIFLLVKTSNPSSAQLQDLTLEDGRQVYEAVADLVGEWGKNEVGAYGYSRVGAVVGATHPRQGAALRQRMPHSFFLLPGYGAQGATGKDLAGMFDEKKRGAVVNASRSLLCAWKKWNTENFVTAAREEAYKMREDIQDALEHRA